MGQNSLRVKNISNGRSDKQWAYLPFKAILNNLNKKDLEKSFWFNNKSQYLRPKGKVAYGSKINFK